MLPTRLALRTPTLPPATHTNCWLPGREAVIVVDPGSPWPDERARLLDTLGPLQPTAVLLTHHHPDHIGGAAWLRERLHIPVLAHPLTAARCDFPVDRLVDEGELLHTDVDAWRVLHTPGHAPGHLCLAREDGVIIAGDMIAGVGTIVLDPAEGGLAQYLDSLRRLRDATWLLPAHGDPIAHPRQAIDELIAHRHQRTAQLRRALARGPASIPALVVQIYPELPPGLHPLAAQQLRCHLDWLAEHDEVRQDDGARWHAPQETP